MKNEINFMKDRKLKPIKSPNNCGHRSSKRKRQKYFKKPSNKAKKKKNKKRQNDYLTRCIEKFFLYLL